MSQDGPLSQDIFLYFLHVYADGHTYEYTHIYDRMPTAIGKIK